MDKRIIITNEAVEQFNEYVKEQIGSGKSLAQLAEEFAKKQGIDCTAEELFQMIKETPVEELGPEVMESAAGGCLLTPGDPSAVTGGCFNWCVTGDTMITMADHSLKRVDEIQDDERLLVWDFDNGCLTDAPLTFFHRMQEEAPVIRVNFSDGSSVGVVKEHVFFDLTDRRFVAVNSTQQEETLKGHLFAKLADGQITEVSLVSICDDGVTDSYYSPVSQAHFNCFTNGFLSISGFMKGLYNVFDLEEKELKYNAEKKAADIKAVGELPHAAIASVVSRGLFEENNAGWFSVSIAKGLTTVQELIALFDFCRPFFIDNSESAVA